MIKIYLDITSTKSGVAMFLEHGLMFKDLVVFDCYREEEEIEKEVKKRKTERKRSVSKFSLTK